MRKLRLRNTQRSAQCTGHGVKPWSGKIPHVTEQLGPYTTTTEPGLWSPRATATEACEPQLLKPAGLEPVIQNKRRHHNEEPAHRNEE
ncbi:hypothetical protein J1605_018585 [Eschrichtius robustus]|uniref:Uncharacterized protein n=1 Tax=Eschrichtius robustus TaxID=9764 RepID=A0AB34HV59_ESCRO|nr:hypothetical protein J1605_018585 [Eschrichtius robustus]